MGFLIGSVLGAVLVTLVAARFVVGRWPGAPFGTQVMRASFAFPLLALLFFALATIVALLGPSRSDRPDLDPGMPILALFFFLVYALVVGGVVGLPTAIVAVRAFRAS